MELTKIKPKFRKKHNPRIGLIALASDFTIEKDFNLVLNGKGIDLYCNRINSYNPLTNKSLKRMANDITKVTKNILPDQKLDCVAYGCTSGTIAAGYKLISKKINIAKPNTKVTTPITSALNAFKALEIKKLSIFTPYTNEINKSLINFLKKKKIEILNLSYLNIPSDLDIGKVDPEYLLNVIVKSQTNRSDGLFISCTALPVLKIINKLEKKLNKPVLTSNQLLIWDTLKYLNYRDKILGYGRLFNN